jgi:hypothetical protein
MSRPNFKPALAVTGFAALLLAGCAQPHAIPTGYTYHTKEFKSATPPPSDKFSDEQRKTMTSAQAEQFRQAVYKLAESLTLRAGMPPKPAYILRPEKMSPFYSNIDNNLNESLRHLGYNLASSPVGAYVFTYRVESLGGDNVRIGLQVHDRIGRDSRMLTEESSTFVISGAEQMMIPYISHTGVNMPNDRNTSSDNRSHNFSVIPDSVETVGRPVAPRPAPVEGTNN